jgi:membrane-bound lytic murein transglycosylase B
MLGKIALRSIRKAAVSVVLASTILPAAGAELDAAAVRSFVAYMAATHGFSPPALAATFDEVERSDRIIELMSRPAEKVKPWHEYRAVFVTPQRVREGVAFWRGNQQAVARAEQQFGVAPEVIVAIIGVETSYGRVIGSYRVIDALATLAFHYPGGNLARAQFFRAQLEQFLLMTRDDGVDPLALRGSYAGAMGMPQFMPESYRNLAVDFNGDGRRDIWHNASDAIGSVANYLRHYGWRPSGAIVSPAEVGAADPAAFLRTTIKPEFRLGDLTAAGITPRRDQVAQEEEAALFELEGTHGNEYWIGYNNFYVISRYNPRVKYALAVAQLAEEISKLYGGSGS